MDQNRKSKPNEHCASPTSGCASRMPQLPGLQKSDLCDRDFKTYSTVVIKTNYTMFFYKVIFAKYALELAILYWYMILCIDTWFFWDFWADSNYGCIDSNMGSFAFLFSNFLMIRACLSYAPVHTTVRLKKFLVFNIVYFSYK
jgi:hypothetical protein